MKKSFGSSLPAFISTAAALLALGCSAPGGPGAFPDEPLKNPGSAPSTPPPIVAAQCLPARAAETLSARSSAMSGSKSSRPTTMFTQELFGLFDAHCGDCHVRQNRGNFSVSRINFVTKMDDVAIATIKINDESNKKLMPQLSAGGKAYSKRTPDDPIVKFVALLEQWAGQNRPSDAFIVGKTDASAKNDYRLEAGVGSALTSMGNCIPTPTMVATQTSPMDKLDAFFASADKLPARLDATDQLGFDSAELALNGMVAYVPTYPLWSDNAGKLRYIRVPRGQSVKFNKATQELEVPPNTRFYKTFLKKVVDLSGKPAWRKIETRLIVSRPDSLNADKSRKNNSLFGTYQWNPEETGAELVSDGVINGEPNFKDRLVTYAQDEKKEAKIRDGKPANLRFALFDENPQLMRHYAIPGKQRCIDCHVGGPEKAPFVLGFTPLQLNRRPQGVDGKFVGGTYEGTGDDELSQLQRLIDYKVITNMESTADVKLLEDSQGTRKHRNEYELKAQGYMLGNCAHCHNPRGLPSRNSDLSEKLNFLPSETVGGIFEFPLESYSPVRKRGADQDVQMPYITPSLYEYPVAKTTADVAGNWKPKGLPCSATSVIDKSYVNMCNEQWHGAETYTAHLYAPWRSLIYRNVGTPFTYIDDYAVFPRMPMHTSSFDCRAPRIMAEWMVSIPARRKQTDLVEAYDSYTFPVAPLDRSEQPYEEIAKTDPRRARAEQDAEGRLMDLWGSPEYAYCPPDDDIIDRDIQKGAGASGARLIPEDSAILNDKEEMILPADAVPNRAHFFVSNLTDVPGEWGPKNGGWESVLVKGMGAGDQKSVAEQLQAVKITDELRAYALTEIPAALWTDKPGCAAKLAKAPSVSDPRFMGAGRPVWMDETMLKPDQKVYMQRPGETIFRAICRNCHGPLADSGGALAEAIKDMTGGRGLVANFRTGLFGPVGDPGANRKRVFGVAPASGGTTEEWAARYFSWMALGGTEVSIPDPALSIVASTPVFGQQRLTTKLSPVGSPNMLKLGQDLCGQLLAASPVGLGGLLQGKVEGLLTRGKIDWGKETALISRNGDAEMWQKLCTMGNRQIVRAIKPGTWDAATTVEALSVLSENLYYAEGYPAGAKVLNHKGQVEDGVTKDNLFASCLIKPPTAAAQKFSDALVEKHLLGGKKVPYCPEALLTDKWKLEAIAKQGSATDFVGVKAWATRGAVNVGFAIFLYLDQFIGKDEKPMPDYNHCDELPE